MTTRNRDYYKDLHSVLHQSMDRLIEAGAAIEAHSDILMTEDENEDGSPDQALKLFKAQIQVGGSEQDIAHLQALIMHCSNLLILNKSRSIVLDSPLTTDEQRPETDPCNEATSLRGKGKTRGNPKARGENASSGAA